ncbi:MAG: hypothetical protein ACLP0L_06370 [Solirubrobacteraceae bacterium]
MTSIPIASFLAGSLLTILLPLGVLIAISVWYVQSARRAPDPGLARSSGEGVPEAAVALPDETGMDEGPSGGSQQVS